VVAGAAQGKGETVLTEFQLSFHGLPDALAGPVLPCAWDDTDLKDEVLRHGRQSAAMERLFRLVGATWIDYQDLQMYLMKMPVIFIYHKKKLKSVGVETFQRQLDQAARVHEVVHPWGPSCATISCSAWIT